MISIDYIIYQTQERLRNAVTWKLPKILKVDMEGCINLTFSAHCISYTNHDT